MFGLKATSQSVGFATCIAVSLLVGWLIPEFYEWTGSDQSRPPPLLWQVPLGSTVAIVAICLALPWLQIPTPATDDNQQLRIRFGLLTLFAMTAALAIGMWSLAIFPLFTSGIVCAGAFGTFVRFWLRYPHHRLAASTLLACMFLPYAWVIAYAELNRIFPTLISFFAALPTFYPAALLAGLFGQHFQDSNWIAFLLTASELGVGIWLFQLGPKRTIAYLLFVMLISASGSLVFYQLCVF